MAGLIPLLGLSAETTATLSTIATIGGAVIPVLGAVASVAEGKAQSAEFDRQAQEQRVSASVQAARALRDARVRQSRDRVAMLQGGSFSGTAFDVLSSNQAVDELDAATIIFQGEQAARGSEAQAQASKVSPLKIFSAAVQSFSQVDPLNIGGEV